MARILCSRGLVVCSAVLMLAFLQFSGTIAIGVNYGTVANDLPTPAQVVALIQTTYISQVKIYDTNPDIIAAFANTEIALTVGARNDEIASLAASESFAQQWISQNVASHYPATQIIGIVVGNEVLTTAPNSSNDLLPAMQNLYTGLSNLGLSDKIKVTTPHSYGVLDASYPPSAGIFRADLADSIFTPMLNFLAQTGSPFMINLYPYFAYRDDPKISISYALFEPTSPVVDSVTGLSYSNLFDAQVDAAYAAISKLGHNDITVVVSESGWPSFGDADEVGVGTTNAQTYVSNLLQHVNSGVGTPAKPGAAIDTIIFALFNENLKPGPSSERNFGLFLPDQTAVYNVGLVTKNVNASSPPPPVVSTNAPPPAGSIAPAPSSTPPASPTPSSLPPPFTTATPPPPYTAPPPPYPVPHIPPAAGSIPSPAEVTTPPAASPSPAGSPPPEFSSPPPPVTAPPPPSFFNPPPGSASPPPPTASGTPPFLPSPPPPPSAPATSPPPPPAVTPSPVSPPPPTPVSPVGGSSPPPTPAAPSPQSPPTTPVPTVPSPATGPPPGTPPAPPGTASGPNTWCVAKPGSAMADLANALNYACGEGGADCSPIQTGGSCFNPNTLFSHASYAFNSYYALNGRNYWNCFFGNSSLISITNPSYAGCVYP